MNEGYYTREELLEQGFRKLGNDVKISRNVRIYHPQDLSIGDHVRIDDFCVLSGKISIGNYVHLSQFVCLYGGNKGIEFSNFIAVAARTMIYAVSDDYVQASLETPMVPEGYKKMIEGKVFVGSHVIFGANTIVLPDVTIAEGSTFGALSLVLKNTEKYSVNVGIPCKKVKNRSRNLLDLEKEFLTNEKQD